MELIEDTAYLMDFRMRFQKSLTHCMRECMTPGCLKDTKMIDISMIEFPYISGSNRIVILRPNIFLSVVWVVKFLVKPRVLGHRRFH